MSHRGPNASERGRNSAVQPPSYFRSATSGISATMDTLLRDLTNQDSKLLDMSSIRSQASSTVSASFDDADGIFRSKAQSSSSFQRFHAPVLPPSPTPDADAGTRQFSRSSTPASAGTSSRASLFTANFGHDHSYGLQSRTLRKHALSQDPELSHLRPEKSPIRSPVPPSKVDNLLDVVIDLQDDNKKLREDNEKLRTALKTAIKDAADLRQRFDMSISRGSDNAGVEVKPGFTETVPSPARTTAAPSQSNSLTSTVSDPVVAEVYLGPSDGSSVGSLKLALARKSEECAHLQQRLDECTQQQDKLVHMLETQLRPLELRPESDFHYMGNPAVIIQHLLTDLQAAHGLIRELKNRLRSSSSPSAETPVEDVPSKSAEQQAELDAIRQQLHATEVQVLEAHKTNQDLMRVVSEYESALFRPSSVRKAPPPRTDELSPRSFGIGSGSPLSLNSNALSKQGSELSLDTSPH